MHTSCHNVHMSVNVSVRLDDRLAEQLRLRARAAGETLSDRQRLYADEGTRLDEHSLITFRDGPTGRRAGLIGGPDVWEVSMWLDHIAAETEPLRVLSEESGLSRAQIDAVVRYRSAFPEEIDARIALHHSESTDAPAR